MKTPGNFLASGPAAVQPAPAKAPQPAAPPARTPVSDGSSQMPMVGDRQKIARPPVPQVASSQPVGRQSNDVNSGMASALGAMADQMHPVKPPRGSGKR